MESQGTPLEVGDLLAIAEGVLGIDGRSLRRMTRISEAESALAAPFASFGGQDFYPDPAERAAILASRIVRNHPLPDGNKRVALIAMLYQLERGGLVWDPPEQAEISMAMEALASRAITEEQFVEWVTAHVRGEP